MNLNKCCIIVILSPACIAIMENTDMENTDMECTDMPSLSCSRCTRVVSKGGEGWERDNPSEHIGFCNCPQSNAVAEGVGVVEGAAGFDSDSWEKIMEDLRKLGEETNDAMLIQQANIGSAIVNERNNTISVIRNNFK